MTLEQLKKLAETNPMKLVTLHRKKSNPKTEKVIWDTIEVIATVAYNNLRKPYEQKLSGWKKIYLERDSTGSIEEEFVFTKNSLSNPNLIEQLKEAGFVKVEATTSCLSQGHHLEGLNGVLPLGSVSLVFIII